MHHATTRSLVVVLIALAGCVTEGPSEPIGSDPAALTQSSLSALTVTANVAAAMASLSDAPPASMGDGSGAPMGLDGPGMTEPRCTRFAWHPADPLRLTIIFNDCIQPSGEILDGSISVWLSYDGVTGAVGLDLDNLRSGATTIDGFLVLSKTENVITVSADVDVRDGSSSLRVVLVDARVTLTETTAQLDGAGSISVDGTTYNASANALLWDDTGNCFPGSGVLTLSTAGAPTVQATMGEDAIGPYAMIAVGELPPFQQRLTCP